jgi:hypothetical protein
MMEKYDFFNYVGKIQDIYGFLVKNLDLDSNLYNLKKTKQKS